MQPEQLARLRDLLLLCPPIDHAGRTVGRTLYCGWGGAEDLLGIVDDPGLAEMIVLAYRYAREQLLEEQP